MSWVLMKKPGWLPEREVPPGSSCRGKQGQIFPYKVLKTHNKLAAVPQEANTEREARVRRNEDPSIGQRTNDTVIVTLLLSQPQ